MIIRLHVFADLRPYICTFASCEKGLAQFPTRATWADHEFAEHRIIRSWSCPECARQCDSEIEWIQHLGKCHQRSFVGPQHQVAKKMAYKVRARPTENEECPLCQVVVGKPRREFVKHVGRHMEEIALMALPQDNGVGSEAHSTSTESESSPSPKQQKLIQAHHVNTPEELPLDFRTKPYSINKARKGSDAQSNNHQSVARDNVDHMFDEFVTPSEDDVNHRSEVAEALEDSDRIINSLSQQNDSPRQHATPLNQIQAFQDYQLQIKLLELQNKKRQSMARQGDISHNTKKSSTEGFKSSTHNDIMYSTPERDENRETANPPQKPKPAHTTLPGNLFSPILPNHVTDQLTTEGDEYTPREYDSAGEAKVNAQGFLQGGRQFKIRTFCVAHRREIRFMLATECARVLGYRDSYLLFNKNRSLFKIIASQAEKDELIHREIVHYSYRSRQIAIVTAKSIFRQFGARVIVNGRRVRDDYWEAKAIRQGFTEEDMAEDKRPGAGKAREAASAFENSNPIDTGGPGQHQKIIYTEDSRLRTYGTI